MTAPTKSRPAVERTEHPHVVRSEGTMGGEPRIDDWRLPVRHLYNRFNAGTSPAEMVESFPFLTLAQVLDGLSYAFDHPDEMAYYEQRNKIRAVMKELDEVMVNGRLILRARLRPEDVPPGATVYTWETLPKQEDE